VAGGRQRPASLAHLQGQFCVAPRGRVGGGRPWAEGASAGDGEHPIYHRPGIVCRLNRVLGKLSGPAKVQATPGRKCRRWSFPTSTSSHTSPETARAADLPSDSTRQISPTSGTERQRPPPHPSLCGFWGGGEPMVTSPGWSARPPPTASIPPRPTVQAPALLKGAAHSHRGEGDDWTISVVDVGPGGGVPVAL
jgi:hypothetical protein